MRLPTAAANGLSTLLAGVMISGSIFAPLPAPAATDGAAIGTCLLKKAPLPLARCVLDPVCATNLLCIQTCTGRADEATCQIKCGDEFGNVVTEDFTRAAVTETKCVPQRADDGSWPVPKDSAVVSQLSIPSLEGDWYISAGLNKAFDTFDCQLHKFSAATPTKLVGNLQWRIKDPVAGTNFVTRYVVQTFDQDPKVPGILYNHDNEYLHYQDDWYVLAANPKAYFVVYYRGSNDAWDGYGGAVVYTREPTLPEQYVPEIRESLERIGVNWNDFTRTDNSCRAAESKLEELEADLQFVSTKVGGGIQLLESEIAKDAMLLEREVEKDLVAVEKEVEKDIIAVEGRIERGVIRDEQQIVSFFQRLRGRGSGAADQR